VPKYFCKNKDVMWGETPVVHGFAEEPKATAKEVETAKASAARGA
jgi:hypothetical protein